MNENPKHPPIIDYEGSDYQTSFWEKGGRDYEDRSERIALKRLLPDQGELLLEIGAGAGRNTPRYSGYQRVVLLDYSLTQLQQAQENLGRSKRTIYVAGDVYRLPFVQSLFDAATMIRTLHHMKDPLTSLIQVQRVLKPASPFILEYANKQNSKAILRYWLGRQQWSPFTHEAVEFAELNYDFHPTSIRNWLEDAGFEIQRQLTVSHFRINLLKKVIPTGILVFLDSILQPTGNLWQLSPSVFIRSHSNKTSREEGSPGFFKCPACGSSLADMYEGVEEIKCTPCGRTYPVRDGIFDFRI
jgi:ubiquinone/menaquinone biosynthesis C-methylase UbiE